MIDEDVTVKHLIRDVNNLDKYDNISKPVDKKDLIFCDTTYTDIANNNSSTINPVFPYEYTPTVTDSGYFKGNTQYDKTVNKTDVICKNCLEYLLQNLPSEKDILYKFRDWKKRIVGRQIKSELENNLEKYVEGLDFISFTRRDVKEFKNNLIYKRRNELITLTTEDVYTNKQTTNTFVILDEDINKYDPWNFPKDELREYAPQPKITKNDPQDLIDEFGIGPILPMITYDRVTRIWEEKYTGKKIEFRSYLTNPDKNIRYQDLKPSYNSNEVYTINSRSYTIDFELDDATLLGDGYRNKTVKDVKPPVVELYITVPKNSVEFSLDTDNLPLKIFKEYTDYPSGEFVHLFKSSTRKDGFTYCGYPVGFLNPKNPTVNPNFLSPGQKERIHKNNICPECKDNYDGDLEDLPDDYYV